MKYQVYHFERGDREILITLKNDNRPLSTEIRVWYDLVDFEQVERDLKWLIDAIEAHGGEENN